MSAWTLCLPAGSREIRALAFDMDATLTQPYHDFNLLRKQLNYPTGDILSWLQSLEGDEREEKLAILHAFERDGVEHAAWNDGAEELLELLRNRGVPFAVVTRNSRAALEGVCERLGLFAETMIAREDAPPKPLPGCIEEAARRMDVRIDQLAMVGDYYHDLDAARAAGAIAVLLTNGVTPPWPYEADLVIDRLQELPPLLAC